MERYAIIIKTDGVCVLLHCYPGDCLSLEEMQNLPVNQTATDLSAAYNDVIVGNAILLGTTDEDFIGLTERAAQNIMKKWELGVC